DPPVMPFQEQALRPATHQSRGRHRSWAPPGNHRRGSLRNRKRCEHGPHLKIAQRRPVRFGEFFAHAMDGVARTQRTSRANPNTSVATPATANDRIDADIHGSTPNPIHPAMSVHHRAHHDTCDGLISWYMMNPSAHGTSISQRDLAPAETSHRPRDTTKKSITSTADIGTNTEPSSVRKFSYASI